MVLDFKVNIKIGCRDDNQFFLCLYELFYLSALYNLYNRKIIINPAASNSLIDRELLVRVDGRTRLTDRLLSLWISRLYGNPAPYLH